MRESKTYPPIPPSWSEVQHIDFLEVGGSTADSTAAAMEDSLVGRLMCWLATEQSCGPSTNRDSAVPTLLILKQKSWNYNALISWANESSYIDKKHLFNSVLAFFKGNMTYARGRISEFL